jgi:hypothetical protein
MIVSHGMGLRQKPDPRDGMFMVPRRRVARPPRTHYWPFFSQPLDQGNTGTCVEHGWRSWAIAAPIVSTRRVSAFPQYSLYREMITIDEWDDNDVDPDLEFGTSVRAGAKVFRDHGFLDVFRWSPNVETTVDLLAYETPIVIGVPWYTGMFEVDKNGFIDFGGRVEGGHCVCLIGWSQSRGAARGINSWGSWGQNGRFWILGEDLERWHREDGEFCIAQERRTT